MINYFCSGYVEIGRQARFRFLWRKSWGFESLYPHQHRRKMSNSKNDKDLDTKTALTEDITESAQTETNSEEFDFISFDEINAYATFLGAKERLNGFRPGKIPLQLLYAKYPIVDNLIEMYSSIKNGNLYKEGFGVKIAKIDRFKNGIKILYEKFPIEKKEEEAVEVDIGD